MGKRSGKVHIICRRCGKRAYHVRKKKCAACGFGKTARRKKPTYQKKR